MADLEKTENDATGQLFDEMDRVRAGMLGIVGADDHMQPMSHFIDRDARCLYFITSSNTDLVRELGLGGRARYCVIGKDQDFHACLTGPIRVSEDKARLDELWSKVAEAWFEGGREDPRITLLEMPIAEAAVWASTGNPLKFGWEVAMANVSPERTPEVGAHKVIDFRRAA